jgi:hypothetical protein
MFLDSRVLCIHTCRWSGLYTKVKNNNFYISTYHSSLSDPTWKHKMGMVIWKYDTFSAGSANSCGFLICVYYCLLCSLMSGEHKQMLSNKTFPWLTNVLWHIYNHNWSNKTNKNVVKAKISLCGVRQFLGAPWNGNEALIRRVLGSECNTQTSTTLILL